MISNQDRVKGIIGSYVPVSMSAMQEILSITEYVEVGKGETFIESGKREQNEYFLIEGICRSYLHNNEGEDITISFFNPKSVLSPFVTRTQKRVSLLNFQALTEVSIGRLDASQFEQLMVDELEIRRFGNAVLLAELHKKVDKEIQLASLSARERLHRFREQHPNYENLVHHPIIASYLGITNVSLSRLRKETIGD